MTRGRATSLKDVAKAAGVSAATISRFLNGSLELPAATRQRIERAVERLGYAPNPHARRLSRGRSDAIGLVVPDIANPFFATLVAAIEEEAASRGLAVSLYATLNRTGREVAYLSLLDRNHVDGLVFVTNHPDDGELGSAEAGDLLARYLDLLHQLVEDAHRITLRIMPRITMTPIARKMIAAMMILWPRGS